MNSYDHKRWYCLTWDKTFMGGMAGGTAAVFRWVGGVVVTILVGPKRAGKAIGFETILGGSILGVTVALVLQAGKVHVFAEWVAFTDYTHGWWPLSTLYVAWIGAVIGAVAGLALHLLKAALDDTDETT